MAQPYFSLVTTLGRNKLAASAAGGPVVVLTHFAVGDGNGADTNPTAASTALVREVWRTAVESVVVDPDNPSAVLVTAIIPTTSGGWWMREFGIFDSAGTMIAVARPVSQYKPTALEGQLEDIRYEFQIIVGETANVTLLVDPSVLLASRDWVMTRKIPMAQMMRPPWLPVVSMTVTAPPAAPAIGDTYLVPAAATGSWAGNVGKLAEWTGAAWSYLTPPDGHGIGLPDGSVHVRVGGAYIAFPAAATTLIAGILKLATDAQALDRTVEGVAIDPKRLHGAFADLLGADNLIVNPLFRINQDGFAGGAVAGGAYAIDMWGAPTGVASNMSFSNGVATIISGKMKQVIEDPGVALGNVTLHWEGTAQCSANGAAAAASPITVNHAVAGNITVEFGVGTVRKPMMAVGDKPIPFRTLPLAVDQLNCFRTYFIRGVAGQNIDYYVPTNVSTLQTMGFRFESLYPTRMRVTPSITILSRTLVGRATGTISVFTTDTSVNFRCDVAPGEGVVGIANLQFKADARIAL